jgi:hypothetical protein
MTLVNAQIAELKAKYSQATVSEVGNGAHLVQIRDYDMPAGWDRQRATILFLMPAGYPAAQPDCFWIEPGPVRLQGGGTPQNSNDTNEIPGVGQRGTWFSWHLQGWNPNADSLMTYLRTIRRRLEPAR